MIEDSNPATGAPTDLTAAKLVEQTEIKLRDEGSASAWNYYQQQLTAYDRSHATMDPQGNIRRAFAKSTLDRLTEDGMIPALAIRTNESSAPARSLEDSIATEVRHKIATEGSAKAWEYYSQQRDKFVQDHPHSTDSEQREFFSSTYQKILGNKRELLPALHLVAGLPYSRPEVSAQGGKQHAPAVHIKHGAHPQISDADKDKVETTYKITAEDKNLTHVAAQLSAQLGRKISAYELAKFNHIDPNKIYVNDTLHVPKN